jgi:hypothetical protein
MVVTVDAAMMILPQQEKSKKAIVEHAKTAAHSWGTAS